MTIQLPIKCSSFRVTLNGTRYRIWSDGSVSLSLHPSEMDTHNVKTVGDLLAYEKSSTRLDPHSEEGTRIRKEALRLRRNKLARESNQARRDVGLVRTPYGWE